MGGREREREGMTKWGLMGIGDRRLEGGGGVGIEILGGVRGWFLV